MCPSDKVREATRFYPHFVDFTVDILGLVGFTAKVNHSLVDALVMKTHGDLFNRCSCLALSVEILSNPLSVQRVVCGVISVDSSLVFS